MPASGARSGTTPNRPAPAGDGKVGGHTLACGHITHAAEPVARPVRLEDALWRCPEGCGLVKRRSHA